MLLFYAYLLIITLYAILATYLGIPRGKKVSAPPNFEPRVLVMVPCRGRDISLKENLVSLKDQNYGNYDTVAIVDGEEDEAVPFIRGARLRYIITDPKLKKGSGKVRALATAMSRFGNYDVYAIADSDVLFGKNWLKDLVAPLSDKRIGLSTTFPYFEPIDNGFWSRVKLVWGFVGLGMMESEQLRFAWGGSLAFRSSLLDRASFEKFKAHISDDTAISKIARSKGLKIAYAPDAQPTVRTKETFDSFWEWANRQTAHMLKADGRVFALGVASYAMSIILLASAAYLTIFYSYFALFLFVPFLLGTIRNYARLKGACSEFLLINTIMPLIFIANLLIARSIKSIEWRGRIYDLRNG